MPAHRPPAIAARRRSRPTRRYRSGIRPLEDRVTMSGSAWSQLDFDEAAALLSGTTYVQNELVVALKESSPSLADVLAIEAAQSAVAAAAVASFLELSTASSGNPALYQLTLSADADFTATLSAISNWTTVEWVQPNFVAPASAGPEANSAPVLTTSTTMRFPTILEDDVNNTGVLVSALLATGAGGDPISDADAGDPAGIAVTTVFSTFGTWQYSLDNGANWTNFGSVSTSTARLLASDAQTRIRVLPGTDSTANSSFALIFKAWDQSTGVNGGTASASTSGGSTAFSSSSATPEITITAVNDAPSFTKGSNQAAAGDGLEKSVSGWASFLDAGPTDEFLQTFTFLVSNDNTSLFTVQPAINSSGRLTYTPTVGATGAATVTVSIKDNGGTANGGVDTSAPQTFTITLSQAPTITPIGDVTILEDGAGAAILFSVADVDSPPSAIEVDTTTSDHWLAPSAGRVVTDLGGGNYRLVFTPGENRFGTATITVEASDGTSTGSRTFTVNVTSVNDAPSFNAASNHGGRADGTAVSIGGATGILQGPNESGQNLTFLVSNDNPSLFAVEPSISPLGVLTYTFQTGAVGSATVSVRLKDDAGTANGGADTSAVQTFELRVTEPPTIGAIANPTILEDAYMRVQFSVADSDGPLSAISVTHSATGALVPATGRFLNDLGNGNYELIYVPTPNTSGTAIVTITANDGFATATRNFLLSVTSVNDVPSFLKGADQIPSGTTLQTVNGWATAISAGANEASQTLTFIVSCDNSAFFAVQPSISSTGVLTYRLAASLPPGTLQRAVINVQLRDNGGTAAGGVDTSAIQTFVISIPSPAAVPPGTLGMNEDTTAFWDTFVIDTDTPDELLTAVVTAVDQGLFPTGSLTFTRVVGDVWRLTAAPAPNAFGTTIVYIDLTDDRGSTNRNQVTLVVGPVNDAPSFTVGPNLVFSSGTDTRTIVGWATGLSAGPQESQTLAFIVTNDNSGLFAVAPAINAAGDLTFTQAAGLKGTAVVTVRLTDSGGTAAGGVDASATQTFTITLSAPPAIGPISDVILNEDGAINIDVFVDDPDTAPAELLLSAVSADGVLLPADRATFVHVSGSHWRMTLAPAADRFGQSTVTVTAAYGSSTASTSFLLTVVPVNDPPTFALAQASLSAFPNENIVRSGWIASFAAGPHETGQNTTWLIAVDNPSLFADAPSIDSQGTLRFRGAGIVGTAHVTLRLRDDAGGADTSPPQVFEIRFTEAFVPSGLLDPTFDGDGRQTLGSPVGTSDLVRDAVRQADGKIVLVGPMSTSSPGIRSYVMRLNADGTLDTTFGTGGYTTIYNPTNFVNFQMFAVELASDGKIVVAGDGGAGTYVARFNTDGTWDDTFGTAGATYIDGASVAAQNVGLAIGPDGKIVTVRNTTSALFQVARLSEFGVLDPTFGTGGKTTAAPGSIVVVHDVAVQSDGKVVAAGVRGTGTSADFFALRFTSAGVADTSFNVTGLIAVNVGAAGSSDTATRVLIQPDGNILLAGTSGQDFGIVRLTAAGTLDTTFDTDGKKVQSASAGAELAFALALLPNGEILIGGGSSALHIVKLNASGALVNEFGVGGIVTGDLVSGGELIRAIVVGPDGSITAAGSLATTDTNILVARYRADGTLDTAFGNSGAAQFDLARYGSTPTSTLVLPDGRIIVAATSGGRKLVRRLNTDGSVDSSFGIGGYYLPSGNGSAAIKIARQNDGKLILLDPSWNNLYRLTADGLLDATFGGGGHVDYTSTLFTAAAIDLAIGADDSIYVVGRKTNTGTGFDEFALARFTAAGVLDTSFDGDGLVYVDVEAGHDRGRSVVVQADGKLLLGGTAQVAGTDDLAVVRLLADGTPDATFSGDGRATVAVISGADAFGELLVDSAGRIVIAGFASSNVGVARLGADGQLDPTFDGDGVASTGLANVTDLDVLLQADGKLLVAGYQSTTTSRQLFAMRLSTDGSRDLGFDGGDGAVQFALPNLPGASTETSAALQPDGKLILVGQYATPDAQDLVVLRLLTAGDLPVGVGPSIGPIADVQIPEGATWSFDFTVSDGDTRPEFLAFAVASSNPIVASGGSFAFTHLGGGVWRATVTGTPDGVGITTVTLSVSDGTTSASRTFSLTTTAVNDAPRFIAGPDIAAGANVSTIIAGWASAISPGGVGELSQSVQFLVEADNPSLFVIQPQISAGGALTFRAASNAAGQSTTVTVRVKDNGGTAAGGVDTSPPQTFRISIGHAPSIEVIADRTIAEGTSFAPIAIILTDADSPLSSLSVTGISGDLDLLPNAAASLTYVGAGVWRLAGSPATDRFGSVVITLNVTDGTHTSSRSFTLNVTSVNDAPSFTKGDDQFVNAGSGLRTASHWAKAVSAGAIETSQNVSFIVGVDDPSLFSVLPTISADGTLTYAAAAGRSGVANVTVRLVDDGGTAGGGVDSSPVQTFAIHVLPAAPGHAVFDPTFDGDGIAAGASTLDGGTAGNEVVVQADGKLLVVEGGRLRRFLADGSVDTAFGVGGTARPEFATDTGSVRDVVVGPDGKIYLMLYGNGPQVVRLNVDGSVDASYGQGGLAESTAGLITSPYAIALQSDGKIVLVGETFSQTPTQGPPAIMRLRADGSVDTSFGVDGGASIPQFTGRFTSVVVRPDGRIAAGGYARPASATGNDDMLVAQFTSDGRPDDAFSDGGVALVGSTPISSTANDRIESIALDAEGRILAFGNLGSSTVVVRFSASGTLDRSFDGDGIALTAFPVAVTAGEVIAGADGRIVAVAYATTGSNRELFAVRLRADGSFDPTFDGDGTLVVSVKSGFEQAFAVAEQADGKLVITGAGQDAVPAGADLAMVRVLGDGSLDPAFGIGGLVSMGSGPTSIRYRSVVRQADGKYLASGTIDVPSNTGNVDTFVVARYLADGTLDVSFGTGGYAVLAAVTFSEATIALAPDGKIVLASAEGDRDDVVRLNADGSLDTSFGGDGSIDASFNTFDVLVQPDGKILVVGDISFDFAVARYNVDGTLDTTFAGTGEFVFDVPAVFSDDGRAIALQPDGKIVLVGNDFVGEYFAVLRINSDGTLDTSFSSDGWTTTDVATYQAEAVSVVVGPDGRITVGGTTRTGNLNESADWALVRYNADGTLDTSFGVDGIVKYAPGGGDDTFGELRLQADGKLVVVGSAANGSDVDTIVVRFLADGGLDPTFFNDGVLVTSLSPHDDAAQGLTIDPDGRIVVVGYAEVNGIDEGRIIRLADADEPPPTVAGIFVRGSTWSPAYLDHLDTTGHGDAELAGLGFSLAAGATQTTVTLLWNNVNRITVRFDRDVVVESADALLLTNSAGDTIAATSFSYVDGRTVEWTVPTMSTSKYLIHVDASKVTGETGLALDGEWSTSTSTWGPGASDGSGNGAAGGSFNFRVNVLAADFDSSGSVAFGEIGQARLQLGKTTAAGDFNYRQDYDGSGSITFGEIGQARGMLGTGLSSLAEPPTPPEAEEAMPPGGQAADSTPSPAAQLLVSEPEASAPGVLQASRTEEEGARIPVEGESPSESPTGFAEAHLDEVAANSDEPDSFTALATADFTGTVWNDLNGDGRQTAGEGGLQYAVAELRSSTNAVIGDADDVSQGIRITDAAGQYQFTGITSGVNYYVVVRVPGGFVFTVPNFGGNDAIDSDFNSTGVSAIFAPAASGTVDLDAGLVGSAPAFGWASRRGNSEFEYSEAITVDAAGNTYLSGALMSVVDFDAGPGVFNLASAGLQDIYVAKYTASGALAWARRAGSEILDEAVGIVADSAGNVIVTGLFQGTVDFDPGAGTANLVSAGPNAFAWKLDADGKLVWARRAGGDNGVHSYAISADPSDNILITGFFDGTADFDPGIGTSNLTSVGGQDIFVWKLDSGGNLVWARSVGDTSDDRGGSVAVDSGGNVLVTGFFEGTVDFDPGSGTNNLTSSPATKDIFVWKLASDGSLNWARKAGSNGFDDGLGVAVDASGNVLITGSFYGTVDFNPGSGIINLTSAGSYDAFVWKLTSAGTLAWARRAGGTGFDEGYAVAVDTSGSVLVSGFFLSGAVDFDPGAGTRTLNSAGSADAFAWKLDGNGTMVWAHRIGGSGYDRATAIAVASNGDIVLTGSFETTADFDPGPSTSNLTSAGSSDNFLARWKASQFVPEIAAFGNGQLIASGDISPSTTDHTDFGSVLVASGTIARTFTISNSGLAVLNLISTPQIQIGGPDAADFTVTQLPSNRLSDGQSTTFRITFDPSAAGLRMATITIQSDDPDEPSYTFAVQGVGEVPPTVVGVYLRGGAWSDSYLAHLVDGGVADAAYSTLGYRASVGTDQLKTLPWNNVNRITVRFNADVIVNSADALSLTSSAGDTIVATSFQYLDARTIEFTLPTLTTSKYLIHLDASKVTGETGLALDGEWTTSAGTWAQGSGDGTAGGSFNFRVNVLAADFDSSGSVAFGEIGQARLQLGKTTAAGDFNYRQDYDGSGSITFGEIGQARAMLGTDLSSLSEPPTPPEADEAMPPEEQESAPDAIFAADSFGDSPSASESYVASSIFVEPAEVVAYDSVAAFSAAAFSAAAFSAAVPSAPSDLSAGIAVEVSSPQPDLARTPLTIDLPYSQFGRLFSVAAEVGHAGSRFRQIPLQSTSGDAEESETTIEAGRRFDIRTTDRRTDMAAAPAMKPWRRLAGRSTGRLSDQTAPSADPWSGEPSDVAVDH